MRRKFDDLKPHEVLAIAIDIERANQARFNTLADLFRGCNQEVCEIFQGLAEEEKAHRKELQETYQKNFAAIPYSIAETDIPEVIEAVDLVNGEHLIFDNISGLRALKIALQSEREALAFYQAAQSHTTNEALKGLYEELISFETRHQKSLEERIATSQKKK